MNVNTKHIVHGLWIAGGIFGASSVLYYMLKRLFKRGSLKKVYPPNTVVLHQFGRSAHCPSISPFCQKLETFLRIAKIPYINDFCHNRASKVHMPWIGYNEIEVTDSQLCIEFLKETFSVNLNHHISEADLGISRAFIKLAEESLMWYIHLDRFVFAALSLWHRHNKINERDAKVLRKKMKQAAHYLGLGHLKREQIYMIAHDDLYALSRFLGEKKYFMGVTLSEVDCILSAVLSQMKYNMPGSYAASLMDYEFKNLGEYCDRVISEVWPDWDRCCIRETKLHAPIDLSDESIITV